MEKIWYYADSGQQIGPYSEHEILALLEHGKITPQTAVWKNGMSDWLPAGEVSEFAGKSPPPPPPSEAKGPTGPKLKLGEARRYDQVNQPDDGSGPPVDVKDMVRGNPAPAPEQKSPKPPPARGASVGFFERIGLHSFESAFFAVTAVLGGVTAAFMFDHWHTIVIALGLLWSLAAGVALVVRAFLKNVVWGLVVLFIPGIGSLIYIIVDLHNAYKPVVLHILGMAAIITAVKSPGFENSPLFEYFEEYEQQMQQMIDEQQQQMEKERNDKLDQFED